MFTKNFYFKDFKKQKKNKKLQKYLNRIISSGDEVIKSLLKNYNYSYTKQSIIKFKKFKHIRIFGMGGSSLGGNAIYD